MRTTLPDLEGTPLSAGKTVPEVGNVREDDTDPTRRKSRPSFIATAVARFLSHDLWSLRLSTEEAGLEKGGRGGGEADSTAPYPWARGRMVKYAAWRTSGLVVSVILLIALAALTAAELGIAITHRGEGRVAQLPFSAAPLQVGTVTGLYSLGVVAIDPVAMRDAGASAAASVDGEGEYVLEAIRSARGGAAFSAFPVQCARVYTECSIALSNSSSAASSSSSSSTAPPASATDAASNNPLGFGCAELFDADPIGFEASACGTSVTPTCAYELSRCGPWLVYTRTVEDSADPLYQAWLREAYGNADTFTVRNSAQFDGDFFGNPGYGYSQYIAGFPDAGRPAPPPNESLFVRSVNGTGIADQALLAASRKLFYLAVDDLATVNRRGRVGAASRPRSSTIMASNIAYPREKRANADVAATAAHFVLSLLAVVVTAAVLLTPARARVAFVAIAYVLAAAGPALVMLYPYTHVGSGRRGGDVLVDEHVVPDASTAELYHARAAAHAAFNAESAVDTALRALPAVAALGPALHRAALAVKSLFPESVAAGAVVAAAPSLAFVAAVPWTALLVHVLGSDPLLSSAAALYVLSWAVAAFRASGLRDSSAAAGDAAVGAPPTVIAPLPDGPAVLAAAGATPWFSAGAVSAVLAWLSRGCAVAWIVLAYHVDDPLGAAYVTGIPGPVTWARAAVSCALAYTLGTVVCSDAVVRLLMAVRRGHRDDRGSTMKYYRALDTALDADSAWDFALEEAHGRIFSRPIVPVVGGDAQKGAPERIDIEDPAGRGGATAKGGGWGGTEETARDPGDDDGGSTPYPPSPHIAEQDRFAQARFEAELRARRLRAEAERAVREDRERRDREAAQRDREREAREEQARGDRGASNIDDHRRGSDGQAHLNHPPPLMPGGDVSNSKGRQKAGGRRKGR